MLLAIDRFLAVTFKEVRAPVDLKKLKEEENCIDLSFPKSPQLCKSWVSGLHQLKSKRLV